MDSKNSFDEKTMIDNNLSNRYIDLDPNGYFIIKVDLEENKIILEHFLNNIDEEAMRLTLKQMSKSNATLKIKELVMKFLKVLVQNNLEY